MRGGSLSDVVDGITSFARRQPAAFLGVSVLAGFVAVRFLKASADNGSPSRKSPQYGDDAYVSAHGTPEKRGSFRAAASEAAAKPRQTNAPGTTADSGREF